jgi:hypothetical protein
MPLVIPWAAIGVGAPITVAMLGYMVGGAWVAGQYAYRLDALEKAQQVQAVETLKTQLMTDEFTIKNHDQRLAWMDSYLRSHPWSAAVINKSGESP